MNTPSTPRLSIAAALLATTAALTACSRPGPPRFEPIGVTRLGATDDGVELVFRISGTNDSKEQLPLRRVKYALSLDGQRVFEGVRSPETTLTRYDTLEFELPAVVPPEFESRAAPVPYRLTGSVEYLTPGKLAEVLFESRMLVPEADLNLSGEIDFAAGG